MAGPTEQQQQQQRLVTCHEHGAEPTGTVVAVTTARRPDGAVGKCIAAVTADGQLVRLAALHGSASPFWAEDSVAGSLKVGMTIEFSRRSASNQPSELPHRNDHVTSSLRSQLEPLVLPSLSAVWPHAKRDGSCRRVHAGCNVPSLAVLYGSILRYEPPQPGGYSQAGRVTLEVGPETLTVRCVCPEISDAFARAVHHASPSRYILVLGLARANLEQAKRTGSEPACEILLIGWAPSRVVEPVLSLASGPQQRKRRKSRASPLPFISSQRMIWIDDSEEAEEVEEHRRRKRRRSR